MHLLTDMDSTPEIVEAVQEFYSLRPTELQLTVGDKLRVISRISGGWMYGENSYGQQGTFPDTHVQPFTPQYFAIPSQHSDAVGVEVEIEHAALEFSEAQSAQDGLNDSEFTYALVLYAFAGNEYDSLSPEDFRYLTVYEGDTIVVKKPFGEEWLWARKENGSEGYVPSAYVSLIESEPETDLELSDDVRALYSEDVTEAIYEEIPEKYNAELQPSVSGDDNASFSSRSTTVPPGADLSKLTHVLIEIYETEKSFLQELTLLTSTLQLHDGEIDTKLVKLYLDRVIATSTDLLHSLPSRETILISANDVDRTVRSVAQAFMLHRTQLQQTYAEYSQNFDKIVNACGILPTSPAKGECEQQNSASSHAEIVRELRQHGMMCFNLETTLLKPVQRVLKYPLLLSQLRSSLNAPSKNDRNGLFCSAITLKTVIEAVDAVQRIAEAVNESKRRQELLDRYRRRRSSANDAAQNNSKQNVRSLLPQKFADTVSFEKVARKSSRFLFEMRTGLGLSELPPDAEVDTQVRRFYALSQCVKRAARDFLALKQNIVQHQAPHDLLLASDLYSLQQQLSLFQQRTDDTDADAKLTKSDSASYALDRRRANNEFLEVVEKQILVPLNALQNMMFESSGPRAFIDKCHSKRLDYARLNAENTPNDADTRKLEQLNVARNVYIVLRQQLLDDLLQLNDRVQNIVTCVMQVHAYAKRILLFRMLRAVEQFSADAVTTPVVAKKDAVEILLKKANGLFLSEARDKLVRKASSGGNVMPNLPSYSANVSENSTVTHSTVVRSTEKTVSKSYTSSNAQPSSPSPSELAVVRKKVPPPRPPPIKHRSNNNMPNPNFDQVSPQFFSVPASIESRPPPVTPVRQQKSPALFDRIFSKRPAPKLPATIGMAVGGKVGGAATKKIQPKRVVYPSYVSESQKRNDVFVVCFSFVAEHDVELSCEPGDVVVVLNRQDLTGNSEWWYVEKCVEVTKLGAALDVQAQTDGGWGGIGDVAATAGRGYVPASYLKPMPPFR